MQTTYTAESIGPYITNKPNALALIEWLMLGAPHAVFNIDYACMVPDEYEFAGAFYDAEEQGDAEGVDMEDCGSVCCIAGAAAQMAVGEFGRKPEMTADMPWDELQDRAVEWLGLDLSDDDHDEWDGSMWPIFDPEYWDEKPTGPAAAAALVAFSQHGDSARAIREVEGD